MPARPTGVFDAERLRSVREQAGLTRAQLATRIDATAEMIGLWEAHGVVPNPSRVKRLAAVLQLAVDDLYQPLPGASPLVKLRVAAGLSQRALAQKVGVSQALISRWERGALQTTVQQAETLADALNAPLAEIVTATGPRPEPLPKTGIDGAAIRPSETGLHLVLVYEWLYERDQRVSFSLNPVTLYSPQGADMGGGDPSDPIAVAARAFAWTSEGKTVFAHHETKIVMDGKPVYSIRRQMLPKSPERDRLFDPLAFILVPTPPNPEANPDPALRAEIRRDFYQHLPEPTEGKGHVVVIAQPDDTWAWLRDQTQPGTAVLATWIDHDGKIKYLNCRDDMLKFDSVPWASAPDLDLDDNTTLHEITERLEASV